ncbi:hypothetical protein CDL12_15192 [Handroanthus impetiginosus]|uniref:Auxilin-like protein and related proteins containing DnaJ domain n=1 Tax=Handroanthus impetiginosus TaxID=429701 RepID=A0A2G9H3V6_9LAMI|nr:hypothetical protein CDL12_15192 [Handroanthus impetiginosus]
MEKLMHRENVFVGHASSQRNSEDLDFNDVFGGPPRRLSMQEVRLRYSFGEAEEEKASLMEKPVFGEESTPRNRRHKGDDFFDDIFRGNEEGYSSPRRGDGVFGSNPGSRIMSPAARPLTPKAEPFGTSLPSQFSLPARLTKTTELPTFSPINHGQHKIDSSTNGLKSPYSSSPLSRFSNQASEIKNVYRQSPLSSNEDSSRSEDNIGNQFHFSIYKWAGKGVPMLMPFVAKNNLKSKGLLKEDLEGKKEIKKQLQGFLEESPKSKEPRSSLNDDVVFDGDNNIVEKIEQMQVPLKIEEESLKSNLLLSDDIEQPGIKEKKTTKGFDSNNAKFRESNMQSGVKNPAKIGVKGKVREFVQIFNQEAADSRAKANALRKSQSLRWKNVEIDQIQNEESSTIAKKPKEGFSLSDVGKKSDVSLKVNENLNNDEARQHSPTRATSYLSKRFSTNMKKSFSSATLHGDTNISVEDSDDSLENFLVQELSDDHEKFTQSESSDDLKAIDAKIQQWSIGKKGNIRSLLSTLQYVLWSGSGWKAIPLVDLIEANSVKRAYQKALLRLHPDKLQQKSVASNQKYIAEKVFDILQEAWDQFNTLGPLLTL